MFWKAAITLIFCLAVGDCLSQRRFSLPVGTTRADYQEGIVWLKVKPSHKDAFLNRQAAGRIQTLVRADHIQPLLSKGSRNKSSARLAPKKLQVDISQYFKLYFDKSLSLEDYINELYATGYFDVVEPVFVQRSFFTPNDPSIVNQYYLNIIQANEAWDVTQGNSSIVIGIVDTGGDLDHPDLQNNIFIDPDDPTDGIDNDGDGYVDNNRGWDFSGSDGALIGTPGFVGDNDPSVFSGNKFGHGTMVAGCASATTNDGVGISGVGFNTKLLFTKHYADNQPDNSTSYTSNLYEGVLYAALHGAKIINCSWGNTNASGIAQDIINYVTLDLGCLVIAAAGNSNNDVPLYPAAYDNVLAVASSDENDVRSWFSNYGSYVDIIAPGSNIYTTNYDDGYRTDSGTSLSAPLVSGAAALVWAHHPDFTGLQVAEQLRASADETFYLTNGDFLHKLGKGRLDIARALTLESPSVRARNQVLINAFEEAPGPGESADLYYDFTNYLQPSSALHVTLTSNSPYLTIEQNEIDIGVLGTNQTVSNQSNPFRVTFAANIPIDSPVEGLLTFTDGAYHDTQLVLFVMPSFIDINENNITTTVTSAGRIGFTNTSGQNNGAGFIYDDESLLFEMGLIMATSPSSVFDNVRGAPGMYNQDFSSSSKIQKFTPGERSFSEVTGSFRNAVDAGTESLQVSFRSMVWKHDQYKNFVILEYKIKNTTEAPMSNFYMGIFADWDIEAGGSSDRAAWDEDTRLGYVYPAQPSSMPRAGVQVLTGDANYYAIDNDQTIGGNPFGLYDGFTDAEKFTSVSNGVGKSQAGGLNGGDVSHVVGSGPHVIPAGEELTIAFALHGGNSLSALINSAKYADSVYNFTFNAPKPISQDVEICAASDATLVATGAAHFNWYTEHTGGNPIASGSNLFLSDLLHDTTLYVSNADESYESLRTQVSIAVTARPVILASGDLTLCEDESVVLTSSEGSEYTWSTGDNTRSVELSAAGIYEVTVKNGGLECVSAPIEIKLSPPPLADFSVMTIVQGENYLSTFSNESSGAVVWLWDFGDGESSGEQEPMHVYSTSGEHLVTLTATSSEGCETSITKTIGIVTGVETELERAIKLYPNPVNDKRLMVDSSEINEKIALNFFSVDGKLLYRRIILPGNEENVLDLSGFAPGSYVVQVIFSTGTVVRKIVISY